jgi:hypothetical protein
VREERLADRGHAKVVPEDVALDLDRTFDLRDLLGRGSGRQPGAGQLDRGADHPALRDLGDAGRVGHDQFETSVGLWPPVPHLGVQRATVVEGPGPLGVRQERLAHVPPADLLPVAEGVDRGVVPLPLAPPRPQEEDDRFDLRVRCRLHHGQPYRAIGRGAK